MPNRTVRQVAQQMADQFGLTLRVVETGGDPGVMTISYRLGVVDVEPGAEDVTLHMNTLRSQLLWGKKA